MRRSQEHLRASVERFLAGAVVVLCIAFGGAVVGAGTALAVSTYVACPDNSRGTGCGFEGAVGRGSVLVTYRFRNEDGGYGAETFIKSCPNPTCPVFQAGAPRPDRQPAGFDVSSDGILTVFRVFTMPAP